LEIARLNAAIHSVRHVFQELRHALGGSTEDSGAARREWAELEALVQDGEPGTKPDQGALAILEPIMEVLGTLWRPAEAAEGQVVPVALDDAEVRHLAGRIADQWRQLLRAHSELPRAAVVQDEAGAAGGATTKDEREARREAPRPVTTRDRRSSTVEGTRGGKPEPSVEPPGGSSARQKAAKRRSSASGMTIECMLVTSGKEVPRILRGEIGRMNNMGLMAGFDERFPEGRQVVVRFVREGAVVACLGRVVRVQEAASSAGGPAVFNHLVRFESPLAVSGETLQAFAS
jgi:hypothetical protein